MAVQRLVVVGGDAAGMSAASRARRLRGPGELEITAFERGRFTSYSACGIPYWAGGVVDGPDALIARTPQEHRDRGIDVRMRTEVTGLDLARQRVLARDLESGEERWHGFDHLVLATGARPVRPPLEGIDAPGVHGVQTLEDGRALVAALDGGAAGRRAVVVGAGYIGVEMAEALVRRGYAVTVVERSSQPMATLDPDMGALVRDAMTAMGIEVVTDTEVTAVRTGPDGTARAVATDAGDFPADVVVLGLGVRPETTLARAADLPLGASGGLLTDRSMRVRGHENVWAGGDCVEVLDLVSGRTRHIALGTHANKHGQVIGANVTGGRATFPGVVGTAVSKVCDLEIARTGLLESQAREEGLRYVTATIESTSRAGYYPGARPMTVKMLAEHGTGRLLGVQIVGREGAAKRVDVAAVALTAGMTVDQMTSLDLGYAPPFSPVWDPVLVAARRAVAAVEGGR
ncbi:flavoprotein oxidoreductase [Streptomyces rectiverticillatus]|uniref:FAD-dependent oxidoreductase n=1 Tax=Streptomyces rectiverticillatus TaxID=173860 RepID=UPI0015C3A700|nr:FAD-dependent oxidoreductase [Streptomyces rectiverticillatus]QLE74487.1 flavoprotein oxidoreductase [Streptomyces rectiverticillatus]